MNALFEIRDMPMTKSKIAERIWSEIHKCNRDNVKNNTLKNPYTKGCPCLGIGKSGAKFKALNFVKNLFVRLRACEIIKCMTSLPTVYYYTIILPHSQTAIQIIISLKNRTILFKTNITIKKILNVWFLLTYDQTYDHC